MAKNVQRSVVREGGVVKKKAIPKKVADGEAGLEETQKPKPKPKPKPLKPLVLKTV